MRSLLLLAAIFCCASGFAQDCANFYFMQANKTVEMAIYDKKGNKSATQIIKIGDVSSSGGTMSAETSTEMVDKKGKTITTSKSKMKCNGGVIMVDMKMSMPVPQQGQNQPQSIEADAKVEDMYIEYPSSMSVGDKLKDATMHLDIDNAAGMKQTVDMNVSERKVEGKEKITTPAGSWDCFKISSKTKMRIKTMGIGFPMNYESIEWYAPGFGMVKSESKHGKTEIVSIK